MLVFAQILSVWDGATCLCCVSELQVSMRAFRRSGSDADPSLFAAMAAGFVLKIVLSQGDNAYMMGLYIIEQLVRQSLQLLYPLLTPLRSSSSSP